MFRNDWYRNQLKLNELVARFDLDVMSVGQAEIIKEWTGIYDFNSYCFYRLPLPLSGKCHLIDTNGITEMTNGKLYLIPPHLPLKFKSITPYSHYYLHFSSAELYNILPPDQVFCEKYQRRSTIIKTFERIIAAFSETTSNISCFESFEVRFLVEQLLVQFIDHHYLEARCSEFPEQRFSKVLQYIEEHINEKVEISQLRKIINMSSTDFIVKFNNYFGMPPKQYIINRKLSVAKRLLIKTSLPIKEVAESCGYQDEFYFSRIFKKYFHESPRDFRAKKYL